MKTLHSIWLMSVLLVGVERVGSAPPAEAKPKGPLPQTNAIPQSVFRTPANLREGRDPFFPNSTYWFGAGTVLPLVASPSDADVKLVLNGLSGTADHRLAMINGKTMAEAEEAEVSTPTGRVKVRCIQINADSVVIEIAGQRKELRLRD